MLLIELLIIYNICYYWISNPYSLVPIREEKEKKRIFVLVKKEGKKEGEEAFIIIGEGGGLKELL